MAHYGHHERQDTDPIPLRRVVRQRPLTDEELDTIYGRERYESLQRPHPPYVRSSSSRELDADPYRDYPRRARVYSDELAEIPMRRSRWGFVVVGLVVLAALVLLGYAIAERSSMLPRMLVFGEPEVVFIVAEPIAARGPLDVSQWQSLRLEASAEPNRGPGMEQAEDAPAAAPKRVLRSQRSWAPPAPKPAEPAPAETPYPSLDPPPGSELEQPAQTEPAQPETAPGDEGSDGILRDPGF